MITEPKTYNEYMAMIEQREATVKDNVSNCIGTAEYLTGEQREDASSSVQHNHIRGFNGRGAMTMSSEPREGYIVAWNKNGVNYHTGVVKSAKPMLISNRANSRAEFKRNQPIEQIEYEQRGLAKMFYIPHKLARITE